jgi:hypothetical protein
MKFPSFICFVWCVCLAPGLALAQSPAVSLSRMNVSEISSARGDKVVYTVRTTQAGALTLEVLTGDSDVVRRLELPQTAAGEHEVVWDGKDQQGKPVPDEAYCARAVLQSSAGKIVDDPCNRTGGEVINGLQPLMGTTGDITYTLEHPARVLIRVGVKNGAMMRSLSVWRPRPAGRNLHRWSGFDDNGQIDLRNERTALLVTAFRLPDFTVMTTGQASMDYRAWRIAQGWPEKPDGPADSAAQPLERKGQRIARQHYMARYKDSEPRISVVLSTRDGKTLADGARLPEDLRVAVDLHPDDRWLMQEQLYEVAFFVNGDFVSEEENGYVPIGWIWNTATLKPGRHLLTVNLTGFTGRVGTKTIVLQK